MFNDFGYLDKKYIIILCAWHIIRPRLSVEQILLDLIIIPLIFLYRQTRCRINGGKNWSACMNSNIVIPGDFGHTLSMNDPLRIWYYIRSYTSLLGFTRTGIRYEWSISKYTESHIIHKIESNTRPIRPNDRTNYNHIIFLWSCSYKIY